MAERLFLPSVYVPCPTYRGTRFSARTLEITYRDWSNAEVLGMTIDAVWEFFIDEPAVQRSLGYLLLGQQAAELPGGEAQRIKLATELQHTTCDNALYTLDEPTTGLHPADVDKLIVQVDRLIEAGNIVIEHAMRVPAVSDWVIDIGAADDGGQIVVAGPPRQVAAMRVSRTALHLKRFCPDAGDSADYHSMVQ